MWGTVDAGAVGASATTPPSGARPKFNSADGALTGAAAAAEAIKTSSPLKDSLCNNLPNVDRLNLSAISASNYAANANGSIQTVDHVRIQCPSFEITSLSH